MPQKNKLSLTVQFQDKSLITQLPRPLLRKWVQAALKASAELTLRFVDMVEARNLNRDFRGKDYATNVLTFTYDDEIALPEEDDTVRADIILCAAVLEKEAAEQGKTLQAHTAHLVVHGVLHAQGYDHENDDDAVEMEMLEKQILVKLGLKDPYL